MKGRRQEAELMLIVNQSSLQSVLIFTNYQASIKKVVSRKVVNREHGSTERVCVYCPLPSALLPSAFYPLPSCLLNK